MGSKTDDEVKINESTGFKTDQRKIRAKIFFDVNILPSFIFTPLYLDFIKTAPT